jgi:cell division protein FtsW (lipid II flippase)
MIIGRTRYRVDLGPEAQGRLPVSFTPVSKAHRLPAAEAGDLVAAASATPVTVAPTPERQPLAQGELGPSLRLMNGGERIVRLAAILGIALAAALSMLGELKDAWRNRSLLGGGASVLVRLGLIGATTLLALAPEVGFALGRGGFGMLAETRATILAYGLASLAILLTGRFGLAAMALWLSLLSLCILGSLTLISLGVDAEKTDFAIHAVKNKLLFIDILPVAAIAVALVSDRAIQALPRRFFAGSGKLDLLIRAVPAAMVLVAFVVWGAIGTETGVAGFQPVEIGKLALVLLLASICVGFARIDLFYTRGQYAAWLAISLFTALVFFLLLTAVPFLKSDYSPVLIILSTAVILFFSFLLPTAVGRVARVTGTLFRRRAAPQPRQRRLGWPRGGVLAGVLLVLLALNALLIAVFPKLAVYAIAGQWTLPTDRSQAIDALERARDGSFRVPAERLLTWYDLDHDSLRPPATDAGVRPPDVAHRDLGFQLLQSKVALAEMPCRMARLSSGLDRLPAETREALARVAEAVPDPCALSPDAPRRGIREPGEAVPEGGVRGYSVGDLIRLPVVQNDFIATYMLVRFGLPIGLWLVLAQVLLALASIAIAWRLLGQRLNGVADETARHGLAITAFGGAALFALHWSISWGNAIGLLPVMGQPMTFIAAATSHHLLMALPVSVLLLMAGRVAAIRAIRVRRAPPAWGGGGDDRG